MAFVNELIPEEEKDRLPFPVDTRPSGYKPTLWKWTIDRERDAVLVHTGGGGGGHQGTPETRFFTLHWKGILVHFSANPFPLKFSESGVVMSWRIYQLDIPPSLLDHKKELLQIITEAFATMGRLYDGERFLSVNVDFDCSSSNSKKTAPLSHE